MAKKKRGKPTKKGMTKEEAKTLDQLKQEWPRSYTQMLDIADILLRPKVKS